MLQVPDSIFWKIAADETAWGLQLAMRELPELDYGRCLIFSDRLEELGYEQAALFCRATSHYFTNQALPTHFPENGEHIKKYMREHYGFKFGKSNLIGSKLKASVAVAINKRYQLSRNCIYFEDRRGYHFSLTPFFAIPSISWNSTRFISSHAYAPATLKESVNHAHIGHEMSFLRLRQVTGCNDPNLIRQSEALRKARQSYFMAVAKQEGWYWIADLD